MHIWPTRQQSFGWPHNSWESRYVGSLRAIRTSHLDGYLLKSLDGLPLADGIVASKDRLLVKQCYGMKLCLFHLLPNTPGYFRLSFHNELDVAQMAAIEDLRQRTGITIKIMPRPQGIKHSVIDVVDEDSSGRTNEHWLTMPAKALLVPLTNITSETVDAIMDWRRYTGDTLGRPYDIIVRACGWRLDASIYHPSVAPILQSQKKYPQLTAEYESTNVRNMYFCGTLAHGKDWKRAAGGFIHGFRYTAQALHRILESKYEGASWAASEYKLPAMNSELARHILRRINEASGAYQMFYTIGDGMVMRPSGTAGSWTLQYMEDIPIDYFSESEGVCDAYHTTLFHFGAFLTGVLSQNRTRTFNASAGPLCADISEYAGEHRMMWLFGFDRQHRSLTESIKTGTGFEPWVWYWGPDVSPNTTAHVDSANYHMQGNELFRMIEHIHTDWSGAFFNYTLQRWLYAKIATVISHGSAEGAVRADLPELRNRQFADHQGFDAPIVRQTSGFKAVSVDVTVVHRLSTGAGALTLSRVAAAGLDGVRNSRRKQKAASHEEIAVLQPGEFHRLSSYEGDRLLVVGTAASAEVVSEEWVVSFRNGVVQERHITDASCVAT